MFDLWYTHLLFFFFATDWPARKAGHPPERLFRAGAGTDETLIKNIVAVP